MGERDPVLRRVERNAAIACVLFAVVGLVASSGDLDVAMGVLGGGLLVGLSYWAIKGAVDGLVARVGPSETEVAGVSRAGDRRPGMAWPIVKLTGRYALLGFVAYVMIARLRLHPIGLLAGASCLVAAAAAEAIRFVRPSRTSRAR